MNKVTKPELTFFGERAYDDAGMAIKLTRNWLRELGYCYVRDAKGLRRLVRVKD